MTKADLVNKLKEKIGFSSTETHETVDLIFELMKQSLESEKQVKISGFGNFKVKSKKVRPGRNPQTGESIAISPRNVLSFKSSPVLTKRMNGG